MGASQLRWHVGAFANRCDTVLDQDVGIVCADFVLRRTRKGNIARNAPRSIASVKFGGCEFVGILGNATAANFFELFQKGQLFFVKSIWIMDES